MTDYVRGKFSIPEGAENESRDLIARNESRDASSVPMPTIVFQRYVDHSEGAFLVLVPRGWITQGGMVHVNPMTAVGGVGQSVETKIDFRIMREAEGKVMVHYLPKINFVEPSPYNAMLGGSARGQVK